MTAPRPLLLAFEDAFSWYDLDLGALVQLKRERRR
jgi:hypothetical protein